MRLLALDTATEFCSAAISTEAEPVLRGEEAPRQHAQLILPFVKEVLAEAEVSLADLDGLVIGRGPGSFTGVRIAAGVGQGLAFSQQLPVVGVSSLQAMAQQAYRVHGAEAVVAAIDARMGEVYYAYYRCVEGVMQPVTEENVGAPSMLPMPPEHTDITWYAVGTGFTTYPELFERLRQNHIKTAETQVRLPHAVDMLVLGEAAFRKGKEVAAEAFEVHYVRNEVTWQKLPGRGD